MPGGVSEEWIVALAGNVFISNKLSLPPHFSLYFSILIFLICTHFTWNDYVHCRLHIAQSQMTISCSFNSNFSVSHIVKYGGFVAWPSADFPVMSISSNSMVLVETVSFFLHGLPESRNWLIEMWITLSCHISCDVEPITPQDWCILSHRFSPKSEVTEHTRHRASSHFMWKYPEGEDGETRCMKSTFTFYFSRFHTMSNL